MVAHCEGVNMRSIIVYNSTVEDIEEIIDTNFGGSAVEVDEGEVVNSVMIESDIVPIEKIGMVLINLGIEWDYCE